MSDGTGNAALRILTEREEEIMRAMTAIDDEIARKEDAKRQTHKSLSQKRVGSAPFTHDSAAR